MMMMLAMMMMMIIMLAIMNNKKGNDDYFNAYIENDDSTDNAVNGDDNYDWESSCVIKVMMLLRY